MQPSALPTIAPDIPAELRLRVGACPSIMSSEFLHVPESHSAPDSEQHDSPREAFKSICNAGLVILMAAFALLVMYVVIWLTSPFKNKIMQVSVAFAFRSS